MELDKIEETLFKNLNKYIEAIGRLPLHLKNKIMVPYSSVYNKSSYETMKYLKLEQSKTLTR